MGLQNGNVGAIIRELSLGQDVVFALLLCVSIIIIICRIIIIDRKIQQKEDEFMGLIRGLIL